VSWPVLRSRRGAEVVAHALGVDPCASGAVIEACRARVEVDVVIEASDRPSRAHPRARGRYVAGEITLFPRAFADPLALAHTVLHELAHAAGADEHAADALAIAVLRGAP
jgi:hypothetical protein